MSQRLMVCSPATRTTDAGTLALYKSQLAAASIPHHLHLLHGCPPLGWGMATNLQLCREWCHQFADYEFIVLTDSFDVVLFADSAEEVCARIPRDRVLIAAEKNCYPDLSLRPRILGHFPERDPDAFINGGCTAGTPAAILAYCDAIERHPKYNPDAVNQWFLNELLADGEELGQLDYRCELFQCLFGGYAELEFEHGRMVNTRWGTRPLFAHMNGKWSADEMWRKYEASLLAEVK